MASVQPGSTSVDLPWSEPARRGAALFNGQTPLAGRIAGHDRDLPASVTRCAACHDMPPSTSPSLPITVAAAAGGAQPRAGSPGTFGPALDARSLLEPRSRRGGPP